MTRHLMRLIWNRKRQNFLLTLEIFFSFVTLFGVVLFALHYANNARQPLGFTIDRIWSVSVDRKESSEDPAVAARHRETYRQLLTTLRELPQIEVVAGAFTGPYANSNWGGGMRLVGGRKVEHGVNKTTDDYLDLFQIPLVAGRWFSREDDAAAWTPVVLNRRMATEIFGDQNPIGQIIKEERDPNDAPPDPKDKPEIKRVIGVIEDFRQNGELSTAGNYSFLRMRLDGPDPKESLPDRIFIRLKAGTPAAFEETLVKRAMLVATDWSFEVQPLDTMRQDKLRQYAIPLLLIATIALFLLLMVALGLTGVVWQSVTQRIREFGLRRAKGATIAAIRRQVLVEMVIMTSLALIVGVVIVGQLPLLPLPDELQVVPGPVFLASLAVSVVAIYLLTLACGWYPSRLATRIEPAEALHYE
ncbi:MAG: FtsX-like permease family protein [Vicinamibacterales bacterium]